MKKYGNAKNANSNTMLGLRRIFCVVLSALMLMGAVSCTGTGDTATSADSSATAAPQDSTAPALTEEQTELTTVGKTETDTPAETTEAPAPDPRAVVGLSFDSIMLNDDRLNQPDGNAGKWIDKNLPGRLVDGSDGFVLTIGFRGWIGFGLPIESFGYQIGDAAPVFADNFTLRGSPDIDLVRLDANGGAYAERFAVTVPVSGVSDQAAVRVLAKLSDGTVADVAAADTSVSVNFRGMTKNPAPVSASSDSILKILQYNLKNNTSDSWSSRAEALKKTVEFFRPDSIGMQEVTPDWFTHLNFDALPANYAGVGVARAENGEATPIYYRTDKFELLASGTFWLSSTPDVPSSLANSNYPRIATWVRLKNKTTGYEYVHINTHLDNNGSNSSTVGLEVRTAQMQVVLRFIASLGDVPCVLTGDMNQASANSSGKEYDVYKQITGKASVTLASGETWTSPLADARSNAAETVSASRAATMVKYFNQYGADYNPAKLPIDYIFYTPAALDARVYRTDISVNGFLVLSDHLSVYGEFAIK